MRSLNKIDEYVSLVCEQIRWKKAHIRVADEMKNHIIDQRDFFIAQGLDEEMATDKAITNTGDATAIGVQLDRTHRPKPQWRMLAATAVLLMLGILVRTAVYNDANGVGLISFQLLCMGIGITGMFAVYFADFSLFGKYPKAIYFSIVALSVAVLYISPLINGRSYFAQYSVLLFPLAFALIVYAARNKGYIGIILCGLSFALPGFIALLVPSISGFLHFAIAGAIILGISIYKKWFGTRRLYGFLLMLVPAVILVLAFLINMTNYQWSRLAATFDPSLDPYGSGYWINMTRDLLSGAKLFGQGNIPGEYTIGLTELLPNSYADSLLTLLISRVGWIAFAIIIGVMLFFIIKGFMLCFKQKSGLGFYISLSIMMTFSVQVISYIAFNLGVQFASPISLPLISYGNSAMIINLVLIGFMLSVFRTGDVVTDGKVPVVTTRSRFVSWDDGKLTIDIKNQ